MAELQPKIAKLNEIFGQMDGADGVDKNELVEIKSELADIDLRTSTVREETKKEEER